MISTPPAPEGITVTRSDGTRVSVTPVFDGRSIDWRHLTIIRNWSITLPGDGGYDLATLDIGVLPGRTGVTLRLT